MRGVGGLPPGKSKRVLVGGGSSGGGGAVGGQQPNFPEDMTDEQQHFQHTFSNNAFASAILNDDASELSGENHRNEVMESIMNHEAAYIEQQQRVQLQTMPEQQQVPSLQQRQQPSQYLESKIQQDATVGSAARGNPSMSQTSSEMSTSTRKVEMPPVRLHVPPADLLHSRGLVKGQGGMIVHEGVPLPLSTSHVPHEENQNIGIMDVSDNYSFRPNDLESVPVPQYSHPYLSAHHPHQQSSIMNRSPSIASSKPPHHLPPGHVQTSQLPTNGAFMTNSTRRASVVSSSMNSSNTMRSTSNRAQTAENYQTTRRRQSNDTDATRRTSIFSAGMSSIKVQIAEFDRLVLQRKENSDRSLDNSTSYHVPLPLMPYETKNGMLVRMIICLVCFTSAILITIFLGRGQFGHASSSFMYHNFVLRDDTFFHHHTTLNDEMTKNGSHLFQKVLTLEKAYRPNVIGDVLNHTPHVYVDENGDIVVTVDHEMIPEHHIQFIWVKHVDSNQVVLARNFDLSIDGKGDSSSEGSTSMPHKAVLKAKVPDDVRLKPYLFCNRHELWVGNEFHVPK